MKIPKGSSLNFTEPRIIAMKNFNCALSLRKLIISSFKRHDYTLIMYNHEEVRLLIIVLWFVFKELAVSNRDYH